MDLQEQMKEYSALKALQIILALAEQKGWVNISDIAETGDGHDEYCPESKYVGLFAGSGAGGDDPVE